MLPPKFCLRHMRKGYSVADCEQDERAAFASRLFELSQLTWNQIFSAGRHGQGFEKISQESIRDQIPIEITEDVKLVAFRCVGKAPMVGYRTSDGVLSIVWIDREFELYSH